MSESTTSQQDLELENRLRRHPMFRDRNFLMRRHDRRIVVEGNVPTFYEKQMVQEIIRRIDGVEEIVNDLTVDWPNS